jgi:FMN reductase
MAPPDKSESLNIIGICGSFSPNGATENALKIALQGALEYGASAKFWALRDVNLVFFGSVSSEDYPPDVVTLRDQIRAANAIILATPEYHGSMSGALKNLLDLMSIEDFETKIVGLIGVAGGHTGATHSLNTMRTICRNLHCWVLPQDVSIASSSKAFDDNGSALDPNIQTRLLNVGRQAVKLATLQQTVQQGEFMETWKELPTW